MTMTVSALAVWIEARRRRVDEALATYLPQDPACPRVVADAMRYSVLAGGKRLRPLLALAAAEACAEAAGTDPENGVALALPAACALELVHTYSLVHDDLPAMDNDSMRRGRPTSHVVFGEGMAILAGDALLTEAFALLAREPAASSACASDALATRRLEALRVLAEAAGAAGMVGGQAIDLQAAAPGAPALDAAGINDMHARKTGALIRAAAVVGAIMAGADSRARDAIAYYGEQLGLAFQIVDDILDVEGASADLGKTAGKDAAAGKPTYPAMYGLDESKRLAARCHDRALAALDAADLRGQLPAIAGWVISRTS